MNSHLAVLDFDGTIANTFEDSPNGMNVGYASRMAIGKIFGQEGMRVFDETGGLRNREPGELIGDIQKALGIEGGSLERTHHFVDDKLSLLVSEIGPMWPRFYEGAKSFLQNASGESPLPIDIAILSSGHDAFISRALKVNDIDPAGLIIVTSDLIRERKMPSRPRYKPNSYQLAEAHRQWLVQRGLSPRFDDGTDREQYLGRALGKPNMFYVGDDPAKDGGLAREARIPFVFVPFTKPDYRPDGSQAQLKVRDFIDLRLLLDDPQRPFRGDESFAMRFFEREDSELFPPLTEAERPWARVMQEGTRRMEERR